MFRALRVRFVGFSAASMLVVALAGCSSGPDLKKAKSVVETALNSWKNGEKAKQLESQGIVVVDPDWDAGHKLLDYTVKSSTAQPQQGPRVVVVLETQDKRGKKKSQEIGYEVQTDASRTRIERDVFHTPAVQ